VPPAVVTGAERMWLGAGVVIMEHCELRAHSAPGATSANPLLRLGDGTRLARFVTIWATVGVHIGEKVSTSDSVSVVDCWWPPGEPEGPIPPPPAAGVTIEDGAYLGYRCVIGPGVTVGTGAFVGEGAVVLSDVAPHTVVYGNPARVTKHLAADGSWQGDMFGADA
jgi:acetyltransferase-like isoleucine patch superfamily enzyme